MAAKLPDISTSSSTMMEACGEGTSLASKVTRVSLSPSCQQMPVRELTDSTWHILCQYLDTWLESRTASGLAQDWRGLAELVNVSPGIIETLETQKSKTKTILWQNGSNVLHLWQCLIAMGRQDILSTDSLHAKLEADCQKYHERLRKENEEQDHANFLEYSARQQEKSIQQEPLLLGDILHAKITKCDAFLSFCESDTPVAKHLVRTLENVYKFSICINIRDMLAGLPIHFATAEIMAQRCSKIILLMSPAYLKTPECDFQLKVAQNLSIGEQHKRLVPIIYADCNLPRAMKHVCTLEYSSEYFWSKLTASLLTRTITSSEFSGTSKNRFSSPSNGYFYTESATIQNSRRGNRSFPLTQRGNLAQTARYKTVPQRPQTHHHRQHELEIHHDNSHVSFESLSPYSLQFQEETMTTLSEEEDGKHPKDVVDIGNIPNRGTERPDILSETDRPLGHPDITELCPNYNLKG